MLAKIPQYTRRSQLTSNYNPGSGVFIDFSEIVKDVRPLCIGREHLLSVSAVYTNVPWSQQNQLNPDSDKNWRQSMDYIYYVESRVLVYQLRRSISNPAQVLSGLLTLCQM